MNDFTEEEWDAVCLKCGKCCVLKEFKDGWVNFSNRVCDGLDMKTARCVRYERRLCSDCAKVDMNLLRNMPELLPESCAYRMLYEGRGLPLYHPLVTGDENSVRKAKQTVLDWSKVHSCQKWHKELFDLNKKADDNKWTEAKFNREERKLYRKYELVMVESYPIPQGKKVIIPLDNLSF